MSHLLPFFLHWGITALCLWAASHVFKGLRIDGGGTLAISALLLGLANTVLEPVIIVLTFPLTLLTLGVFLLVIDALMLMLVARLVRGFTIRSFGTAFMASIFISLLSLLIRFLVSLGYPGSDVQLPPGTVWL